MFLFWIFFYNRNGISFTIWDRWTIHGKEDFTLLDFINAVKVRQLFISCFASVSFHTWSHWRSVMSDWEVFINTIYQKFALFLLVVKHCHIPFSIWMELWLFLFLVFIFRRSMELSQQWWYRESKCSMFL